MFKGLIQFIKSKTFVKHLLIYIVSLALLFWIIIAWLGATTNHGITVAVPDFAGLKIIDLDRYVTDKKVKYIIIDSLYDTKAPKGVVVKQEPEAGDLVKENRTIYLYVTSVLPPRIQMPKLIDHSLRQASAMITTFGLRLGKTKFVPDQCANCILDQLVKGKRIAPGELIEKGTVVDLVVGKGLSEEEVVVPCLYGLSRKEALAVLSELSLSLGTVVFDNPKDSISAKVYKQSPSCGKDNNISMGASVDLFLTTDKNKIPETPASSINSDEENFDE